MGSTEAPQPFNVWPTARTQGDKRAHPATSCLLPAKPKGRAGGPTPPPPRTPPIADPGSEMPPGPVPLLSLESDLTPSQIFAGLLM